MVKKEMHPVARVHSEDKELCNNSERVGSESVTVFIQRPEGH